MLSPFEQRVLDAKAAGESVCLGCGCTDSRACSEGCRWILVDRRRGIGVCSQCEVLPGARVPMEKVAARSILPQPDDVQYCDVCGWTIGLFGCGCAKTCRAGA